jgi:hypothetical protein
MKSYLTSDLLCEAASETAPLSFHARKNLDVAVTYVDYSGDYEKRAGEEKSAYEFWWAPLAA